MKQRMIILSRIYYAIVMRYHREKATDGQNSNGKNSLIVGATARDNMSGMSYLHYKLFTNLLKT